VSLVRTGEVEHCHGVVRFAWAIDGPDGTRLASGTNVADACLDGRFSRVTGFWDALASTMPYTKGRTRLRSQVWWGRAPCS